MLEEREGRRREGGGRREAQACDCNTRGTAVVSERDRCEIEKETERRGADYAAKLV